jgi:hypothetical protein
MLSRGVYARLIDDEVITGGVAAEQIRATETWNANKTLTDGSRLILCCNECRLSYKPLITTH